MKDPLIKIASKLLKPRYHLEYRDDNIIELSMNSEQLPFAFLIIQDDVPGAMLISYAVDMADAMVAADLALILNKHMEVALAEEFYIDNDGSIQWGMDAHKAYTLEADSGLGDLTPISSALN